MIDCVEALEDSIKHDIQYRILNLAEFISLPQVCESQKSHQPLMSGLIGALGNTSRRHPLCWLSQRFEILGGRWGAEARDARRLQFRYHNTIQHLSELSELSEQARIQSEQIWQDLMG